MKTKLHSTVLVVISALLLPLALIAHAKPDETDNIKYDKSSLGPVLTHFTLVDADTGQNLFDLKEGMKISLGFILSRPINIIANHEEPVDNLRVHFVLSGPQNITRTEKKFPYALFGDINGDYNHLNLDVGIYHLQANFSYEDGGCCGPGIEVNFEVIHTEISQFTVINDPFVEGESEIIENRQVYNPNNFPFSGNAVIFAVPTTEVGSIKISISGPLNFSRIENIAPYSLFGDSGGEFGSRLFPEGEYQLTATPYTEADGQGFSGVGLTKFFKISSKGEILGFEVASESELDFFQIFDGAEADDLRDGPGPFLFAEPVTFRALTTPWGIGSVKMEIEGPISSSRIENVAPYSLFGDGGGIFITQLLPSGTYQLTATPFNGANGQGNKGEPHSITFHIIGLKFGIPEVRLIDAQNFTLIANLTFGGSVIIDNRFFSTNNVTIVVEYPCADTESCPESVFLSLERALNSSRTENVEPYTLFGDINGVFNGESLPVGEYLLSITGYSGNNLTGIKAPLFDVFFEIINSSSRTNDLILYPNPARTIAHVETEKATSGIKTVIFDLSGNKVKELSNKGLSHQDIDISELRPGIYIVQIHNGHERITKKLVVQ